MEQDGNSSVALTPAWHSIGARALSRPGMARRQNIHAAGDSKHARIAYSWDSAVVVVEGATLATFVTGTITMLIIGILLNIVGLGIFCWALFALATHALPFFVSMTVGIYSFQVGAGSFGAIVVGLVAGSTTFVAGQFAFSVARSPIVRLLVGLLFALPAARAGYDVTLAFAHIGALSEWWREVFAVVGAITVGGTAWARMSIVRSPTPRSGVAPVPPRPPMGAAATSR
jgi:hypothetical protein